MGTGERSEVGADTVADSVAGADSLFLRILLLWAGERELRLTQKSIRRFGSSG